MSSTDRIFRDDIEKILYEEEQRSPGLPVQEHLECHIEVELSAILKRANLPPKATVTIVPRNVDWVAVARTGQLEIDPTDIIEVHWQSHREGAL